MLSSFFYQCFLGCFSAVAAVGALFSTKIKAWRQGRKNWKNDWVKALGAVDGYGIKPLVWVHASSLGEFEQAWPVALAIRQKNPSVIIAASFFSPSGLQVIEKKKMADACGYLPFDNDSRLHEFFDLLNPKLVIWSKYDYWYNTLKIIQQRRISTLLVSAIFRKNQPFFQFYGRLYREMLRCFSHIFVQDMASCTLLTGIGLGPNFISVSGDTRFDRVLELRQQQQHFPLVEQWLSRHDTVLVAGSTWPEDHQMLAGAFQHSQLPETVALILAPHEIGPENIGAAKQLFPGSVTFSELKEGIGEAGSKVLIIDNVGMLSQLYACGAVAYVGGGFSKTGVHNVLEPAVFGMPVLFGTNHKKYREVGMLITAGGGFEINDAEAIVHWANEAAHRSSQWQKAAQAAAAFVEEHAGATQIIMSYIQQNRLLINA